jgi:Protein of unknown function (DUF2878)
MSKLWNFLLFQAGWFACVLGAAHQQVFWAVAGSLAYIAFHIWRSSGPKQELSLLIKVLIYGVLTDTLIMYLGLLDFHDAWPTPLLSPIWMWTLWLLVASTFNGSLAWLRNKPFLGAVLGAICGPLSYEAGVRMGAASWGPDGQILGLALIGLVWTVAIPLFLYWNRTPIEGALVKNL